MKILFVRHGESEANVQRVFSNRGWKHPLTVLGREQVRALAKKLQNQGVVAIYTSPVRRAVESSQILTERLGVPYEIEPALTEYDVGIYEDHPHAEGEKCYNDVARRWVAGELDARMPEGESCTEIRSRFVPFIKRVIERFGATPQAAIVLVGHGGTYRHALPVVLDNVSCEFAIQNGLGNMVYVETEVAEDGTLHCLRWGEKVL